MFGFKRKPKLESIKEDNYLEFANKALEYIKTCREKGIKDEKIEDEMLKKEYPEALIQYLFKKLDAPEVKKLSFEEEVYKSLRLGKKYLLKTDCMKEDIEKAFRLIEKRIKENGQKRIS